MAGRPPSDADHRIARRVKAARLTAGVSKGDCRHHAELPAYDPVPAGCVS